MAEVKVLEVTSPGPLTTLQDLDRFGFGQYGVAQSGAVDSFSLRVGNRLVGNGENEAGLEMTYAGATITALSEIAYTVTGADMQPQINGIPIPMWRSLIMHKGERLSFKGIRSGLRGYLAVGGGINAEMVLGSRSTNLGAGFGGLSGRPLMKGDILSAHTPHSHLQTEGTALPLKWIPTHTPDVTLRIIYGPHQHQFNPEMLSIFQQAVYNVTEQLDRTGIRLEGPSIREKAGLKKSIISEGVVSGAVQIPGDGQPIIILGETVTGGYRIIACVISADLHRLGQLRPKNKVKFTSVSQDEARIALEVMETIIQSIRA
ncbi:MAG: biotin-dependent carboxyltransferase [Deltaproteobacteria bacterium]|nr:biotin-dependent carboxyltransferase [Deltaproteobacteria bacterium]